MLTTKIVQIDATMAHLFLDYEKEPEVGVEGTNRRWSQEVVNTYAQAMVAGDWKLTHQGIGFMGFFEDDTAELADGGQRLRAVIEADKEKPGIVIPFMVTEGLTLDDMLAMDIGRKRTPGDFMRMNGEPLPFLLAAVIKLTWLYMNDKLDTYDARRRTPLSPKGQREQLDTYPELRQAIPHGVRLGKIITPSAAASFWFLATHPDIGARNEGIVKEFTDGVWHGEHMGKGDARFMLRELMLNSKAVHRHWETHEQLALAIKAFRRWENAEDVLQLGFRVNEQFPRL